MTIRFVHAGDVAPQPWKNGGGTTRELLAWPSPDDWTLRVSVADIRADGPFSAYPGVQRWFVVLDGAGVELAFADGTRTLTPASDPLQFEGTAAPHCRLIDGPTRDLNLMHRGGRAAMRKSTRSDGSTRCAQCGLFSAAAGTWTCGDGRRVELPARTLLWLEPAPRAPMRFDADGWWMEFTPEDGR
jgi:environmental stress-induced protein Ves